MTDLKSPTEEQIEDYRPALSRESMLITTDSLEELSHQINADFKDFNGEPSASNIQGQNKEVQPPPGRSIETAEGSCSDMTQLSDSKTSSTLSLVQSDSSNGGSSDCDDYLHDPDWLNKPEHVFVLSMAGKPIYSLHGDENKLATLFGVMQALVSFVQSNQDTICSIQARGIRFVFLVKPQLILVAVSRKKKSVQQIQMQLT